MQLTMQLPTQLLGSSQTRGHIQLPWQEVANFRPHEDRNMFTALSSSHGHVDVLYMSAVAACFEVVHH